MVKPSTTIGSSVITAAIVHVILNNDKNRKKKPVKTNDKKISLGIVK
jgi:hypothetical protein